MGLKDEINLAEKIQEKNQIQKIILLGSYLLVLS